MSTTVAKRQARPVRSGPLAAFREEIHDLISQALGDEESLWPLSRMAPMLDVSETDQAVEVRMDVPGVEAKEIDIQLNGNTLTVSGERREEKEERGKTFHRVERRQGSFSRSVSLPCPVKEEAVEAAYKDGVLMVTLPKAEEARTKRIKVNS